MAERDEERSPAGALAGRLGVAWAALASRSTRAFYDRLSTRYERIFRGHGVHAERMAAILARRFAAPSRCAVLDLGCGTGLSCRALSRRGFQVTGLDFSARSLALSRRADPRIDLVCGDASALPFADAGFRAVVSLGAWRHFADPRAVVEEIARVMAHDGVVLIGTFPPKLGGFFAARAGTSTGRLAAAAYSLAVRALGHDDDVRAAHERLTREALAERFATVRIVPSADGAHLVRADRPFIAGRSRPATPLRRSPGPRAGSGAPA